MLIQFFPNNKFTKISVQKPNKGYNYASLSIGLGEEINKKVCIMYFRESAH